MTIDAGEYLSLVQHLENGEKFGKAPDWYQVLRAARYCGVSPWEMEANPVWMVRALAAIAAEKDAERRQAARIARRAKARAKGTG